MVESNRRNEITLGGEANTSSFDDSEDDFESPAMGSGNVLEKVTMCVSMCVNVYGLIRQICIGRYVCTYVCVRMCV